MSQRYAVRDTTDSLDPATDYEEIYRLLISREFPWDINQALSFALFRTYAVPSIGALLERTGEFTDNVQKRYDDTGLILDAIIEHGITSPQGRAAVRRMNQMHGAYDIGNDDMLYVLSTFVVIPVRWISNFGWRSLTRIEIDGITAYYRNLGRHMNIKHMPLTFEGFAALLDAYESEHFAYNPGARRVADATLELMATFPPNDRLPAAAIARFSKSLMDDHLLAAFHYRRTTAVERALSAAALRVRGKIVRLLPPRKEPLFTRQLPNIRSYPDGYDVEQLGTFPRTCPVHHAGASTDRSSAATAS